LESMVVINSASGSTYRPTIKITVIMDGVTIPTKVTLINRAHLNYPIIIGKRNLKKFLIDVSK
jgi:hypothetical protein